MNEKKLVSRRITVVLSCVCILLGATIGAVVCYGYIYSTYASTHNHTDAEYISLVLELASANENISNLSRQLLALQTELVGNTTQSTSLKAQMDILNGQLASLNKTYDTTVDYYNSLIYVLNTDNHDLAVELASARNQITGLQNQIDALNGIVNLTAHSVWINNQTVSQPAGSFTTWSEAADYSGYGSIAILSTTNTTFANVTYFSHGVNYNVQTIVGTNGTAFFPILPSSNITIRVGNGLTSGTSTETVTITYFY
jgi:hypothetical protein